MKESSKSKSSFFTRAPLLTIVSLLLIFDCAAFRAMRCFWVFYDPNIPLIGAEGVFAICIAFAFVSIVLSAIRLNGAAKDGKAIKIASVAVFVFMFLITAGIAAILAISDTEARIVILLYFKRELPAVCAVVFAYVALAILPPLKVKCRAVLGVFLAAVVAAAAFAYLFPSGSCRIISDPVVMDTGKDYSVVFATNKPGTASVSYSFNGKEYTVNAQTGGRKIADRIVHAVNVPYEHLKNNSYTIESTCVLGEYGYGSKLGKTAKGGPYDFKVNEEDEQSYLVISDWHTYLNDAKAAISNLGEYDAVIMLGDPAPSMDFEEEAAEYIVKFGGELTNGAIPVIYVRGNHETRGAFADQLPSYLGYDKLYYTVERGAYSFIVLSSGEDKPDDHVEYGGLDDYARFRAQMIDELKNVELKSDKVIALSHAWQVDEPDKAASFEAWDALSALGARFMLSGHTHRCEFIDSDNPDAAEYLERYPGITTYIDGGHSGKTYVASKITLFPGGVHFEAADNFGNNVIDSTLEW